jgi:arsenate reductase
MNYVLLCYPRWGTCRRAKAWLDERGITYEYRDIKEDKPTALELEEWVGRGSYPLKAFFNTSGQKYRELDLKNRLPGLSPEEKIALLASDGMLVKRPLLVGDDLVLVGFKEKEWEENLLS